MATMAQRRMRLAHYREGVTLGLVPPELARNTNTNYASDIYWASSCALDPGLEMRLRGSLVRPLGLSRTSSLCPPDIGAGLASRARARMFGLTKFNGEPHACGTTERYTFSGGCVHCNHLRNQHLGEKAKRLRAERNDRIYSERQKKIDDRTARMLRVFERQAARLQTEGQTTNG